MIRHYRKVVIKSDRKGRKQSSFEELLEFDNLHEIEFYNYHLRTDNLQFLHSSEEIQINDNRITGFKENEIPRALNNQNIARANQINDKFNGKENKLSKSTNN